jgi:hypothetical protein
MREGSSNGAAVQRMGVFTSVHRALESIFETLALIEAVKVPGYSESVARSTVTGKVEWTDRITDAAWAMQAIDATLSQIERAAVIARYHRDPGTLRRYEGRRWTAAKADDGDQKHAHALALLKFNFGHMHAKKDLLEAVIAREFVHGEAYMESTHQIGERLGVSAMAVWRLAHKVQRAVHALEAGAYAALKERFTELGFLPN